MSGTIEILPAVISRPDLRKFARILDAAIVIPGTKITVGIDSLVGLIPGFGDALGGVLSAYIVLEAAKEGVSNFVLAKMIANIAIDSILGSVPIFGDIFDVVWRANIKNIDLLERSPAVVVPGPQNRARLFCVTLILLLLVVAAFVTAIALAVMIFR